MSELRAKGLAGNSNNTSYILKAIYPSVNFGHPDVSHVQQTLAESGMAPQLYLEFWPYIPPPDVSDLIRAELSGLMPLVRYLIMERLLPPGPRKPGWQSLRTLAKQEPESAKFHKRTIQDSLNHTLGHLKLVTCACDLCHSAAAVYGIMDHAQRAWSRRKFSAWTVMLCQPRRAYQAVVWKGIRASRSAWSIERF